MTEKIIEFPDKTLIQERAGQWIVKFEGDDPPTRRDIENLREWMSRSSTHRETLLQLASSWNDMDLLSELAPGVEWDHTPKTKGLRMLAAWLLAPVVLIWSMLITTGRLFTKSSTRFAITTAMLLVTVGVALLPWQTWLQPGPHNLYQTSVGEQSTNTLADGTVLRLNTNSWVEIDYSEERRRIILYKGEAHFSVFPDPQRPFEVYVNRKMIRAVGTAFSVYLDNHTNDVKVTVMEGKVDLALIKRATTSLPDSHMAGQTVALDRPHQANPASSTKEYKPEGPGAAEVFGSLMPGQSIVIPEGNEEVINENQIVNYEHQELLRRLAWLEGRLEFAGEPLQEVVEEVSRYTPLRIEITDPELKNMRIGGQFQVGKIEALFDVLESSFGVEVTRVSNEHLQIHAKN